MLFTATASYQPPSATVQTLISTMGNPNVNLFIWLNTSLHWKMFSLAVLSFFAQQMQVRYVFIKLFSEPAFRMWQNMVCSKAYDIFIFYFYKPVYIEYYIYQDLNYIVFSKYIIFNFCPISQKIHFFCSSKRVYRNISKI